MKKTIIGVELLPLLNGNNVGMISFNHSKRQTDPVEVEYILVGDVLMIRSSPSLDKLFIYKESRISILIPHTEDPGKFQILTVFGTRTLLQTGEERAHAATHFESFSQKAKDHYSYMEVAIEKIEKKDNE